MEPKPTFLCLQISLSTDLDKSTLFHPIYIKYIPIFFYHLRYILPCGFFPSGFTTKIIHAFVFISIPATYHTNIIILV